MVLHKGKMVIVNPLVGINGCKLISHWTSTFNRYNIHIRIKKEELWVLGPSVNEVSFRARPHHNVHHTLGVDTRATNPHWRVDSIEWEAG